MDPEGVLEETDIPRRRNVLLAAKTYGVAEVHLLRQPDACPSEQREHCAGAGNRAQCHAQRERQYTVHRDPFRIRQLLMIGTEFEFAYRRKSGCCFVTYQKGRHNLLFQLVDASKKHGSYQAHKMLFSLGEQFFRSQAQFNERPTSGTCSPGSKRMHSVSAPYRVLGRPQRFLVAARQFGSTFSARFLTGR